MTASPADDAESSSPPPDDRLLLAGDLPYVLGMLGAERVEDPTGDVDGTARPLPDVYGWSTSRCGQPAEEPTVRDPLDWRARSFSRTVEPAPGDLGAEGSLAAVLVVEGIAPVADPTRIVDDRRRALRDCGPAATLPGALSTTGDTPPVVRVDAPEVGDDAVAWRSASLDPQAGAVVYDTVWWRRGDQLAAVTVGWSTGPLPDAERGGGATATPTDADLLALLSDAGEAESRAALALVARELDARL